MLAVKSLMLLILLALLGCQSPTINKPCPRDGFWDGLTMRPGYRAEAAEAFQIRDGKGTRFALMHARLNALERYCYQMRQE